MSRSSKGFTLVELTLSMGFVSMLLLAIAVLTIQISSIYNKGLTLREVDQTGQLITSDIQRTLNASSETAVAQVSDRQGGGRFCIGTTVYAWNYGKAIAEDSVFNVYEDGRAEVIRLAKFQSGGDDFCTPNDSGVYLAIPNDAPELLSLGDRNLAIQALNYEDPPTKLAGGQTLYSVHMTLGTNTQEVIDGDGCVAPKSRVDDEYCAVNQFNFVARAGNKSAWQEN